MARCEHDRVRSTCSVCSPETVYNQYRYKAAQRELTFVLTLDEFKKIVQQRCIYCGKYGTPRGIDRRDNRLGYIPSNCQPCCGPCNFLKKGLGHHEFLRLVFDITDFQRRSAPQQQAA